MSIVKGEDCVVEFYDGSNWYPYVCARSWSLSTVTELIETSVKGSGKFKHFTPTVNSFTGTIDGIVSLNSGTSLTLYTLRQYQLGHVLQRMRFVRVALDGSTYIDNVEFYITECTDTTSFDNISTFTIQLQGTGVLDQTIIQPPVIITAVKRYEFTAVGGEAGFTEPLLINKDILEVNKDGLGNSKIIAAPASPASKEVSYDTLTGAFAWAVYFEPGEEAYVLYQDM